MSSGSLEWPQSLQRRDTKIVRVWVGEGYISVGIAQPNC